MLAVGATGMLRGALDELASKADRTVVASRRATRDHAVGPVPGPDVVPLDLDWHEPETAMAALRPQLAEGVDLALLWIHGTGSAFRHALLGHLADLPCLVVHVLGSRADPEDLKRRVAALEPAPGFRYVTVQLGAMSGAGGWRWLTHQEISQGALEAVYQGRDVVVGDVSAAAG